MRRLSYNEDVHLEAYRLAKIIMADRHREGIREIIDICSSFGEHIRRDIGDLPPLAADAPLPRGLLDASRFARDIP